MYSERKKKGMLDFFLIMFKSIVTDDILILLFAVLTCIVGWRALAVTRFLKKKLLFPKERRANPLRGRREQSPESLQRLEESVVTQRQKMNLWYSFFINLVSIFPLLGMLGTIVALIGLAGRMEDNAAVMGQFFNALTSTAWGIVFALGGKLFDAYISVDVAANNKEADLLLDRNTQEKKEEMLV